MRKKLEVWLIKEGESAFPIGTDQKKLMRTGALAEYLSEQGHKVTWWTSDFVHAKKEYLFKEHKDVQINENERIVFLHSPVCYKRNVSVRRILYHIIIAKQFKRRICKEKKPDIIVCSYPTVQFAKAAVWYGKKYGVPVILDTRDEWPDIFERAVPKKLRPLMRLLLIPMKRETRRVYQKATSLSAVVPAGLEWALNYAGRKRTRYDRVIYLGAKEKQIDYENMQSHLSAWKQKGITENTWNICFFSTLSKTSLDLETVIKAVERLSKEIKELRLIIGGAGDAFEELCQSTADIPAVVLPGWLEEEQMISLMSISKCGMLCYRNTPDFRDAFGNKATQYMSMGLPILTSTEGFAKSYLEKYNAGLAYKEGNVEDCINKISEMYKNPELLATMSQNSKNRFYEDFDYRIVNKQFEETLYDVFHFCNKDVLSERKE